MLCNAAQLELYNSPICLGRPVVVGAADSSLAHSPAQDLLSGGCPSSSPPALHLSQPPWQKTRRNRKYRCQVRLIHFQCKHRTQIKTLFVIFDRPQAENGELDTLELRSRTVTETLVPVSSLGQDAEQEAEQGETTQGRGCNILREERPQG